MFVQKKKIQIFKVFFFCTDNPYTSNISKYLQQLKHNFLLTIIFFIFASGKKIYFIRVKKSKKCLKEYKKVSKYSLKIV